MAQDPSKTEQATPKRVQKEREKGNVPRSQEGGKTMTLLGGSIAMYFFMENIAKEIQGVFTKYLSSATEFTPTRENIISLAWEVSGKLAIIVLPIFISIFIMSFIIVRLQVGKLWTTKVFKFNWNKFNLIQGLQRLFFNRDSFVQLIKSMGQAFVIAIAPYVILKNEFPKFIMLYNATPQELASYIINTAFTLLQYALLPMILIMLADIFYSRWNYAEKLKMSKYEVKDEYKQQEGDPLVKQELRKKMKELSTVKIKQLVPTADVIITNPTHYAIALKYDISQAPAPIVVAKGKDRIAQKIKELAKEHNVPIKENKLLAQALYKTVEIGDIIPPEMYQAVAIILANLDTFKRKSIS
ncbi:MAG: flagellar biosynthesis protein FlhB [Desulfovibrionaceae bacterium]